MKKILALLGLLPLAVQAAVPLLDGVQSAENQLLTQSGRWFVSGENGVFEGHFDGRAYSKQRLTARLLNGQAHQCYFLGMAERQGRLYTVCTDNILNPLAYAGLSQLRRYTLGAAGPQDGVVLFSSWWFLDDFTLSGDGVVVAEFLGNRVVHVSESGQLLREARVTQPTSVQLWRGAAVPAGDVTVTERGSGRLLQLPGFGAWLR